MSFEIAGEREYDVLIFRVEGRIDGTKAGDFQGAVQEAVGDGEGAVVLDCENLVYLASAGLRALLLIARPLAERGVPFALCSLPDPVAEVLEISGLDRIVFTHR